MAYTEELRLELNGTVFDLRQGGEVRINDVKVSTPVIHPDGIIIRNVGRKYVVSLEFIICLVNSILF